MARRKANAEVTPEVKTEEVKVETALAADPNPEVKTEDAPADTTEATDRKDELLEEINELVEKYNEANSYHEYKQMQEIDAKIAEKVEEYTTIAERECFNEILQDENPMKAAAERVRYATIKVRDVTEDKVTTRVVEASSNQIDPLKLHKKAKDGIGADKNWHFMIEKLNMLLTCRRAIELGLDPREIKNTYSMSEEATKIEALMSETDPTKYDKNAADELLKQDVQKVVDAMLGGGEFEVTDVMINYLLMIYQKKNNRKSLSVTCANHKNMRIYLLDICHACVTDNEFSVVYKVKK